MFFKEFKISSVKGLLGKSYLQKAREIKTLIQLPRGAAEIDNSFFGAANDSDISDLLSILFAVCVAKSPRFILELGTRGGESTRALTKYCEIYNASGASIDLEPAPSWLERSYWKHYQGDDLEIGKIATSTNAWPDGCPLPKIDFIFLDSSHFFDHTLEEIQIYWPLLEPGGILAFHDTNLTQRVSRKVSGLANVGWDNNDGVNRAIEEFFNLKLDWSSLTSIGKISTGKNKFESLVHFPWNNGLTLISKS
jgi:predicted O-methyltransferase YrrM